MQGPDVKHLRAVVVLAEERHFSRAAARLHIGQSALTKQIVAVEAFLGFPLFVREPRRVTVTPAGEVFVAEARLALQHLDRAVNLARASSEQAGVTVHIGKSPYTDPYLITKLLSLRLPLFPRLQIQFSSRLSTELMHDVLDGSLDLAFLTGMPDTPRLTGSLVADQTFWIALPDDDPLADKVEVGSEDLRERSCILFERHVQPNMYDELTRQVSPASTPGCRLYHVMTAEDASQLIFRGFGVAILTQTGAWRIMRGGITIRPLKIDDLRLRTRLVARSDNESKLVSDLVRGFAKSLFAPKIEQFTLPLV